MKFFKADPLKLIERLETQCVEIEGNIFAVENQRRDLLLEFEVGDVGDVNESLVALEDDLSKLKQALTRKRDALSEAKKRYSAELAKKQQDEYECKVRKVRDELQPKAIKSFEDCEASLKKALGHWEDGRKFSQEALNLGLKIDCGVSNSKLADPYLVDSFKLSIRKHGPQHFAKVRLWVGSELKIPEITTHVKEGFAHLLKLHKDVK